MEQKTYYLIVSDDNVDNDEIDEFITYVAADLYYDSYYSNDISNITIGLYGPTTDVGGVLFEVEAQDEFSRTRGMIVSVHVIIKKSGNLMTR